MKRLVIMAVCMLAAASAYAQDINGVSMGTVMSEDQIAKVFGKSYIVKPVERPYAKSSEKYYIWDTDTLLFDNGRLARAVLHTDRFAVDANRVKGGIRVGDDPVLFDGVDYGSYYHDASNGHCWVSTSCGWFVLVSPEVSQGQITAMRVYNWGGGDEVEGMVIGQKLSHEEMVSKFGEPEKFIEYPDSDTEAYGYEYPGADFAFTSDYRLMYFTVRSSEYTILSQDVEGGLHVGDHLSKVSHLDPERIGNSRQYMLFSKAFQDDYIGVTVDESDMITSIWFYFSL
jgi:hypothetical protein